MTRKSPKQPTICVWCVKPTADPIWLLAHGSRLPYHPACMKQLQPYLNRSRPA